VLENQILAEIDAGEGGYRSLAEIARAVKVGQVALVKTVRKMRQDGQIVKAWGKESPDNSAMYRRASTGENEYTQPRDWNGE
jgi:hypothetical protein